MIPAHMFSVLVRQHLLLGQRFAQRYSTPWLVWEPGAWKVTPADVSVAKTQLPNEGKPKTPRDADALCFVLPAKPPGPLHVGRDASNDIVLTDVTVSREHCTLRVEGTRWVVRAAPSVKSLIVGGLPLTPGSDATLVRGDLIQLGDVRLTFLDATGFAERVRVAAAQLERNAN